MKGRPLHQRIGFAVAGLLTGWRRERSFRTHVLSAGVALAALLLLRPAPIWWGAVAIVVAMVMALELLNSAMEGVIDLLHPGPGLGRDAGVAIERRRAKVRGL